MKRRPHEHFCREDPDGRCQVCRARLSTQIRAYVGLFEEMERRIAEIIQEAGRACDLCLPSELDYALASMYRELTLKIGQDNAEQVVIGMKSQAARLFSVSKFPLTEKAIRDSRGSADGKRRRVR